MNYVKIMFQMIDSCNLSCIYCSSHIPYTNTSDIRQINYNELLLFIRYVKKYIPDDFYIEYVLTGGEPSLYTNIVQFINILQQDTHPHKIYIRTNSLIPFDNIFHNVSNIYFDITYHYNSIPVERREEYFSTILHNAQFLINNNNFCRLIIMSFSKLSDTTIKNIIKEYKIATRNNNAPYELRIARQTKYYVSQNYKQCNTYFHQLIYIYRTIKVMTNYSFDYGCSIANKYVILPKKKEYIYFRYNKLWQTIKANLFKQEVCNIQDCTCHICTLEH